MASSADQIVAEGNVEKIEAMQAEIERLRAILILAKQVREAQRQYFTTRERSDLIVSKQAERCLDEALANAEGK